MPQKLPADHVVEIDLGCGLEDKLDTSHGHAGVHVYRVCISLNSMLRCRRIPDRLEPLYRACLAYT